MAGSFRFKPSFNDEAVLAKLNELGLEFHNQLKYLKLPSITIPSRTSSNIHYDAKKGYFVLGGRREVRRASHIGHLRSLTQLLWVANIAKEQILKQEYQTLRSLYYIARPDPLVSFEIRGSSKLEGRKRKASLEMVKLLSIVADLEAVSGIPREYFKFLPKAERSYIYGDVTIEYTTKDPEYHGRRLNLTAAPDGTKIGIDTVTSKFIECKADKIIIIEKDGIFGMLVKQKAHRKLKALLICTSGQSPRFGRLFIRRLNIELGLPAYILTDADPWGMQIAMVIIAGAANTAHIAELATPNAKWVGLWASDIKDYKLGSMPLNERDVSILKSLKKDPRYQTSFWQNHIEEFLKKGRKAELDSLAEHGYSTLLNEYLPEKLKEAEYIT